MNPISKLDRIQDGLNIWISFYRANPQRFASGIKGIIAERFMKSLDSAEQETASASEGKPEVVSASIEDDEEPASSESFIKAFLNKKTNF